MILSKTLQLVQSKENSRVLWDMHHVARWAYNEGVRQAFNDQSKQTARKAESILTNLRKEKEWLEGYQRVFLRACFIDGFKAERLAEQSRKKNKKSLQLKSLQFLFRKKADKQRQPAIPSFQRVKLKDNTLNIGTCKITLKDSYDDYEEEEEKLNQIRSYQIVETTKKITHRTRPEDRTYEIHIQYHFEPPELHEGDTKSIDLNVNNMWGISTHDNGSHKITKLPFNAKRRKYDRSSKMQSHQSKVKKGGRTYKDLQRKRQAKNQKIINKRRNFVHKSLANDLKDAAVVIIEDLKVSNMIKKGGTKKRSLNRVMHYSAIGYVKDEIIHYCKKHGIAIVTIPPAGTSITCSVCGYSDKESRDHNRFVCTNCGYRNHADLNSTENLFHRAVSSLSLEQKAAGNVVFKQNRTAMGESLLNVSMIQKERTNPEQFQFGTQRHAEYYTGVFEKHLPSVVPLLLENHNRYT